MDLKRVGDGAMNCAHSRTRFEKQEEAEVQVLKR